MNQSKESLAELEQAYTELGLKIKAFKYEAMVEYPLIMRNKSTGDIAKFKALNKHTIVMSKTLSDIGLEFLHLYHTDTDAWTPVPYDRERDLWHGQPVYCWTNIGTHSKELKFYDAINKASFDYKGGLHGTDYDYYEAVDPKYYTTWMLEAYKTLEGIN